MLDTLSTYRTAFNDAVNDKLINGLFDIPLEEHVKEIISSLETCCSGIKIISMEYHADEHNIHMNDHIIKREKKVKKKAKPKQPPKIKSSILSLLFYFLYFPIFCFIL